MKNTKYSSPLKSFLATKIILILNVLVKAYVLNFFSSVILNMKIVTSTYKHVKQRLTALLLQKKGSKAVRPKLRNQGPTKCFTVPGCGLGS